MEKFHYPADIKAASILRRREFVIELAREVIDFKIVIEPKDIENLFHSISNESFLRDKMRRSE